MKKVVKKSVNLEGPKVSIEHQKDGYCAESCDGYEDMGYTPSCNFDLSTGSGPRPGENCKPGTYKIVLVPVRKKRTK